MLLKKIFIFVFAVLVFHVLANVVKETFAAVGTEVWQSTRANRPTRNTTNDSYDIRGDVGVPFNPYTSPWNMSTLPHSAAQPPQNFISNSVLSPQQFETNSIGLTLGPDRTIEKGYLKGWPASTNEPGWWVNPALLNTQKRWGWYFFD